MHNGAKYIHIVRGICCAGGVCHRIYDREIKRLNSSTVSLNLVDSDSDSVSNSGTDLIYAIGYAASGNTQTKYTVKYSVRGKVSYCPSPRSSLLQLLIPSPIPTQTNISRSLYLSYRSL